METKEITFEIFSKELKKLLLVTREKGRILNDLLHDWYVEYKTNYHHNHTIKEFADHWFFGWNIDEHGIILRHKDPNP